MGSTQADRLEVVATLEGQRIFITGATGFVGKVLVEKLLWSVPEVGKLILLIRPGHERGADQRLCEEVLAAPMMARLRALHGDLVDAFVRDKVEVVAGDLGRDRFGLDEAAYGALCGRVDRVVASAATVTFDERLDRALAINVRGASRTLALARDAGDVPMVQVSTCFVSGRRQGTIAEQVAGDELDLEAVLVSLGEAEAAVKAAGKHGDRSLVEAGARQAEKFGYNDIYTLSKALAEALLARDAGDVPLAIVRPAVVESAHAGPIPGWIEEVRVADPLLVAYGRGRSAQFPGAADAPLELIPVDFVAHAVIAALAALPRRQDPESTADRVEVYQVGSRRNPITLGELMRLARRGFSRTPLREASGAPIAVAEASFIEPEEYRRDLLARRRKVRSLVRWLPLRRTSPRRLALGRAERTLDHLIHLLTVYRPYLGHGASYDDSRTAALWGRLSAADRETFPFDVAAIDWESYIPGVHVPGLVRFALRSESGAPPPETGPRQSSGEILERAAAHAAEAGTLFELFAATAEAYPEVMAFQTCRRGAWLRYSYRQALVTTANIAARLAGRYGIGRGDRVLLWAAGSPEWVLATLAVHRLGATTVPIDPQWPATEMAEAARLVGAKLICAAPHLASSVPPEQTCGCPSTGLSAPFVPEPDVGLLPGADLAAVAGEPGDLASIIFTSGTTVAPKAVPLSHANYLANVRDLVPLMHLTRERLLSVLPIHHVFEQMVGLLVPMTGGSTFSYVAEIKPAEISWMMNTTRPTVLVAVPRLLGLLHNGIMASVANGGPMLKMIFRILFALSRRKNGETGHELFAKVHSRFGGSLRRIASGGSALEPALGRSFQLMGFKVAEGYGMTETSPVLTVNPWDAIRFGSVGRPLAGVEIDLRPPPDDTAGGLAPGAGEVWVRGANVMAGYYQNPEATAAVMRDGWLNTGDIGSFDDEGYLRLSGRTKDVVVTSAGKNVYPEEVEARYLDLPGVAELVILGLPADGGGERVTALVVPAADAGEDEVRAVIAARSKEVPSYQRVSGVEIWHGDLPKTTTMKVKRAVLREAVLAGERGPGSAAAGKTAAPQPAASDVTLTAEQQVVVETLARLTHTRVDQLRAGDRLAELGVDSLTRVELVGEIEARFGLRLDDQAAASLDRVQDLFDLM